MRREDPDLGEEDALPPGPDEDAIELITGEEEQAIEEEEQEEEGGGANIVPSAVIPSLPDVSVATSSDATDSVCAVTAHDMPGGDCLIVSGSTDEKLRVYVYDPKARALSLVQTLEDAGDSVVDVQFSHDGRYLAAGSYDGMVRVYAVETVPNPPQLRLSQTLEGPSSDIEWVQWHQRGYALAAGSKDATAWLWWAVNGNVMNVFSGHGTPVATGCFASDGKSLCTGSADGTMIVWNPKTAEKSFTFTGPTYHTEPITCLAAHPTLPLVASSSEDGTIQLVNVSSGRTIGVLAGHTDSVETLAFAPMLDSATQAAVLASGSLDGTSRIWDCNRLTARSILPHSEPVEGSTDLVGGVTRVVWLPAPHGRVMATASTDTTIRIWDAMGQRCLRVLSGHTDTVLSLAVVRCAERVLLVSGGDDAKVKVWEMEM